MRLSDALTGLPAVAELPALRECRETPDLDDDALAERVFAVADALGALPELAEVDLGLLRAFVYLQRDDHRVRRRIMSLLRCEALPPVDQRVIGGLTPYLHDDDPARLLGGLCRLVAVTESGTLVICLDQLEDAYSDVADETGQRFRAAVQAVLGLVSRTPRVLVVVSCLSNYYTVLRQQLTRSDLDRIEHDPEPCDIVTPLDAPTIRLLIETRLQALYESCAVDIDPADPLWPLSSEWVEALTGLSAREVLTRCQQARDQVEGNDSISADAQPSSTDGLAPSDLLRWKQRWNDHLTGDRPPLPDDDAGQLELLLSALRHAADELPDRSTLQCQVLPIADPVMSTLDDVVQGERIIALCNKTAIGGALARQLRAAESHAASRRLLLVRSTEFPRNARTRIAQQLAELIARKHARRVLVEDADWRAMAAMRTFHAQHADAPGFHAWLRADRPLTILPALQGLLDLDRDDDASSSRRSDAAAPAAVVSRADSSSSLPHDGLPASGDRSPAETVVLGTVATHPETPAALSLHDLTRHAAFLGGSGSGKTTLALGIIEQLLERGVPALLIDRKGDLCRYASALAWDEPPARDVDADRKQALLDRLAIQLFTPGHPAGRPLAIPAVPAGLGALSDFDRDEQARQAAAALAGMLNYSARGTDQKKEAVLSQAISVLVQLEPDAAPTLARLIDSIRDPSDALLMAIDGLPTRLCRTLAEDLTTLSLSGRLSEIGERLDCEALFGLGEHAVPGKTRLSIISTAFLGDEDRIVFWVAQLLFAINQLARKKPSSALQAVILFDEADLYLPALRKPATKQPLESLLRRGRSAGIGVFLSTQSPGDLDYQSRGQINTWCLGKITQTTAIDKLKPLLGTAAAEQALRLPAQEVGQFLLVRDDGVQPFQAARSLVKTEQLPEDTILGLARDQPR